MAKYPRDLHGQWLAVVLQEKFPDIFAPGVVYLDVWPITAPMIVVFHPDLMNQFTVEKSFLKHELVRHELGPFTQNLDLVSSEGQLWKTWRGIFNPGFSAKNLSRLIPDMVEEVEVFRTRLQKAAVSGDTIPLAESVETLTVDVIGRTVLCVHSEWPFLFSF